MVVSPSYASKVRVFGLQRRQAEPDPRSLGVLAFEVGRTMSRLVGLHRAISDGELRLLFSNASSVGVSFLNSSDKRTLLRLACAEQIRDLDAAAAAIARLGRRCGGFFPLRFDHLYNNLRDGYGEMPHLLLGFAPNDVDKKVKKLEKYVAAISELYDAMEDLAQMETKEVQRQKRQDNSRDSFESLKKMTRLRSRVRQLKEESLWNKSFENTAELMARTVVSIFARLCSVYGFVVPELPRVSLDNKGKVNIIGRYYGERRNLGGIYSSGPLERTSAENLKTRNSGPLLRPTEKSDGDEKSWIEKALKPPESSLGAIGMARRYAEIVVFLEKLSTLPPLVVEKARDELYRKLPQSIERSVMEKLRSRWNVDDVVGPSEALASGWREAFDGMLRWLGPIARDTLRWQSERSLENRDMKAESKVLVLQTMMFSDREKAEAAVVELLVAFSYVCRYSQVARDLAVVM